MIKRPNHALEELTGLTSGAMGDHFHTAWSPRPRRVSHRGGLVRLWIARVSAQHGRTSSTTLLAAYFFTFRSGPAHGPPCGAGPYRLPNLPSSRFRGGLFQIRSRNFNTVVVLLTAMMSVDNPAFCRYQRTTPSRLLRNVKNWHLFCQMPDVNARGVPPWQFGSSYAKRSNDGERVASTLEQTFIPSRLAHKFSSGAVLLRRSISIVSPPDRDCQLSFVALKLKPLAGTLFKQVHFSPDVPVPRLPESSWVLSLRDEAASREAFSRMETAADCVSRLLPGFPGVNTVWQEFWAATAETGFRSAGRTHVDNCVVMGRPSSALRQS